ncbi:MAG: hypothetical protein K2H53_02075, partial [Clostridia bacterium]|nr:hypothetical protein [Clostridia bacterium]
VVIFGLALIILLIVIVLVINFFVKISTKNQIIQNNDYSELGDIDCILVLGAGIWGNRSSPMQIV